MRKKKTKPGLAELQQEANKYAQGVASRVLLLPPPPELSNDTYVKHLSVIMAQLVEAWASGYVAGTNRG